MRDACRKERQEVLVCVHLCVRQTCMRVLAVGDELRLATQQLNVETNAVAAFCKATASRRQDLARTCLSLAEMDLLPGEGCV